MNAHIPSVRRRTALASLCALLPGLRPAFAQSGYPNRPIRLIIPFPAGAMDTLGRILARAMAVSLGQSGRQLSMSPSPAAPKGARTEVRSTELAFDRAQNHAC